MKYGFIGAGNMATAIIQGMVYQNQYNPKDIIVYDINANTLHHLEQAYGIVPCSSNKEIISLSDILILAVKPNILPSILEQCKENLTIIKTKLIISIAVGKSIEYLEQYLSNQTSIVRVMPNINAKVKSACSGFCTNEAVTLEQKEEMIRLFSTIGSITEIPEQFFSIFGVIGGSSPAFIYLYIDALARAAQKSGMPKKQALEICAQTVLGSAKMILESEEHPWSLIDQVCSPGGTTIEGIYTLQNNLFETTIEKAFDAVLAKDNFIQQKTE